MPTSRGIRVALQSQYDALVLPEFPAPSSNTARNIASSYVPIYPGSQFWIVYTAPRDSPDVKFYYFKLVINGKCVLSWGAGERENWGGRVSFGMYDDGCAQGSVEKRGFFFASNPKRKDDEGGQEETFEIQGFRAKARRREEARYEPWSNGTEGQSLQLRTSGPLKRSDPKRFYRYALLDPVDAPYATFSYHFRTIAQLKIMESERLVKAKHGLDITTASPSKRSVASLDASPLSRNMLSPPPKGKPAAPMPGFAAKDSIALRRLSLPPRVPLLARPPQQRESPTKSKRELFDALEGLSLASSRHVDDGKLSPSPKKLHKKEHVSKPLSNTGLFKFGNRFSKRRGGSREEQPDGSKSHAR